jgi:hypothetical protein
VCYLGRRAIDNSCAAPGSLRSSTSYVRASSPRPLGRSFRGEHIASSCKKGTRVLVSGKLIQRNFEVEGNKRSSIEVTASAVGPELKFATAEVSKASSADAPAAEDTRAN